MVDETKKFLITFKNLKPKKGLYELAKNYCLRYLTLQLNKSCNFDCIICEQAISRKTRKRKSFLDYNVVFNVLRDAKKLDVKKIILTGGEPTLYSNLSCVIKLCNRFGFNVGIITNSYLFANKDYALKIIKSGLTEITMSVHSSNQKSHDYICGKSGSWSHLMDSIKNLKRLNRKLNILFSYPLNKYNYKESFNILDIAKKEGISKVQFSHLLFSQSDKIKKFRLSQEQMEDFYFNITPRLIAESVRLNIPISIKPFFLNILNRTPYEQILALVKYPWFFRKELAEFVEGNYALSRYKKYSCLVALTSSRVTSEGEVTICCDSENADFKLGNVNKENFFDIWNSEKYKKLREISITPKFEGCKRCRENFDSRFNFL